MNLLSLKKSGFLPGDIVIIAIVIITAAAMLTVFMLGGQHGTENAVIYLDGEILEKISVGKDAVIDIKQDGVEMTVEIADGKVSVSHSNCKNQNCVKSGAIRTPDQIVACIPNGVYIIIEGEASDENAGKDFDAIIG